MHTPLLLWYDTTASLGRPGGQGPCGRLGQAGHGGTGEGLLKIHRKRKTKKRTKKMKASTADKIVTTIHLFGGRSHSLKIFSSRFWLPGKLFSSLYEVELIY